ncbi:MAG TPA: UDP-3-O-(3-hydroxymyristoyl)glucosamine N-acyltransferase [Candidatus Acidoferrales bacterium]|nr:UDP-3-O-(3-hydroxymyristoyl)glucosamine N-acyltransferase [Candidatus Acidoferrales bacterium]
MRVSEIAREIGARVDGKPDAEIIGVGKIEEAKAGEITFLANPKYEKYVSTTCATAVIVSENFKTNRKDITLLRVKDPYVAFVFALKKLAPSRDLLPPGTHLAGHISSKAKLGKDVRIGACAIILDNAQIGDRTMIFPGSVVGEDVEIGEDSVIYSNVTIYQGCKIGNRATIHAGTAIGSDGFGFAPKDDGTYEKIPQLGIVVIEDDVEIGSNSSIDRATLGETRICRGVKIDNLVQVAHNVIIGEDTVIAAQSGISGSTKIGKHCMVGGQVGFAGHLEIADNTNFGAQSGVPKSIKETGKTYLGYPARELRDTHRIWAASEMLPGIIREFTKLQHKVEELENKMKGRS